MSEQQETAAKSCPLCGAEFEKMVCDGAALRFRCGSVFGPSMDPKQGMESDNCCRRQLRQKIKELEWLRADQETNKQRIRELHDANRVFFTEIDRLRRERDEVIDKYSALADKYAQVVDKYLSLLNAEKGGGTT